MLISCCGCRFPTPLGGDSANQRRGHHEAPIFLATPPWSLAGRNSRFGGWGLEDVAGGGRVSACPCAQPERTPEQSVQAPFTFWLGSRGGPPMASSVAAPASRRALQGRLPRLMLRAAHPPEKGYAADHPNLTRKRGFIFRPDRGAVSAWRQYGGRGRADATGRGRPAHALDGPLGPLIGGRR